jgi:hypothetical protein
MWRVPPQNDRRGVGSFKEALIMSNDYATSILVEQRHSELRHEAAQDRLAREARAGQPRRRWWERLMLSHTGSVAPRRASRGPAATVAVGDSPC